MSDYQEEFEIVCSKCGQTDTIPFDPEDKPAVYCHGCHRDAIREKQQRERSAPRKRHGTRVSLRIECPECGQEAELDYVPKGVALDEVLCPDCFGEENESSRWEEVQRQKEREQTSEWEIECAKCGRPDFLNFEPDRNKDYLCTRCFYKHEEPKKGKGKKEALGRGVYVRKDDS